MWSTPLRSRAEAQRTVRLPLDEMEFQEADKNLGDLEDDEDEEGDGDGDGDGNGDGDEDGDEDEEDRR